MTNEANTEVSWELATRQSIDEYYDGLLNGKSLRAVVIRLDGKVSGVIGIIKDMQGPKFFSDLDDEVDPKAFTVLRAMYVVVGWVRKYKVPVHAIASHQTGAELLSKLGFEHFDEDIYLWQPHSL